MSARPKVLLDSEVVELLADEPELLAVADAVSATQRAPRRRRLGPRLIGLAAVLALVAAAVTLVPDRGVEHPFVSEALAAIGRQPVLHARIEARLPQNDVVDLATGHAAPQTVSIEYWFDERRGRLRTVLRRSGVVVEEFLETPTGSISGGGPVQRARGSRPAIDPALAGFVTGYRDALQSGEARVVANGTLNGRKVVWLQFDAGVSRQRVAVDSESYTPISLVPVDQQGRPADMSWQVRVVETVARVEANFVAPKLRAPRPFRGDVRESRPVSSAQALAGVRWPTRWLGESWRGLRLTSLELQTLSRGYAPGSGRPSERGLGLNLRYGADGEAGFVAVSQAPLPEPAYAFAEGALTFNRNPVPREGYIELVELGGAPGDRIRVMGQLRQQGVFVTIWASSRELCLAAARALTRITR
ncbi:MAG TPA: hypothetical protein VNP89_09420 [Gaiellaceae bacterium]|nr:hypothetical protein [Gaiellaceae bacterium]